MYFKVSNGFESPTLDCINTLKRKLSLRSGHPSSSLADMFKYNNNQGRIVLDVYRNSIRIKT